MAQLIVAIIISLGSLAGVLFITKENRKVVITRHIDLTNGLLLVQPTPTPSAINGVTVSPTPTVTVKVKTHYDFSPIPTPTLLPWPTPMPTATPQPNPTPMPTPTPQPTTTPIPTNVPTPTPTIFIAGSGSGCGLEGWRRNCRESCGFQDGRRGYWNIDADQLANGKIVYTECVIVE